MFNFIQCFLSLKFHCVVKFDVAKDNIVEKSLASLTVVLSVSAYPFGIQSGNGTLYITVNMLHA